MRLLRFPSRHDVSNAPAPDIDLIGLRVDPRVAVRPPKMRNRPPDCVASFGILDLPSPEKFGRVSRLVP